MTSCSAAQDKRVRYTEPSWTRRRPSRPGSPTRRRCRVRIHWPRGRTGL